MAYTVKEVAREISPSCIVEDCHGNRENGWYHCMKLNEFLRASSVLTGNLGQWGQACSNAGISCGKLYYIGGSGRGTLTMQHQIGGPFRT